ncbi:MAG: glycosyltransferase [Syntrophomonadaceae bacterium]|jgi:glycosyltransferase involved in cell wall biosynthesis|nr:glycosyltransferase [Syntrophomonadaceae bacterium]
MLILNLGTYPPKQCGIATFSMDLRNSLLLHGNEVKVMAVSEEKNKYAYPSEVVFEIDHQHQPDYIKAASFINSQPDIDLLIIQHEYGIFGGRDGEYIMDLVGLLEKPYVLVTHTVLPNPSRNCKSILNYLAGRASAIVSMTKNSLQMMSDLYEAPAELIYLIAHGVPEFKAQENKLLKRRYGLQGREVVSTFGLIGPGKGLELGIEAVASLTSKFPQLIYLILGRTHPMLVKYEGERYRHMLENKVIQLEIKNQVRFVNKYLSNEELGEYLYMSDIYLSPYPNKDQAVSGTMAFALGCGRAIVSTPYSYALETLSEGRGLVAKEADAEELAALMESILQNPALKLDLQKKAFRLGKHWTWSSVGQQYTKMFKSMLDADSEFLWKDKTATYGNLPTFS